MSFGGRPLPVEQAPGFALRVAEQFRIATWKSIVGDFPTTPQLALLLAISESGSSHQQELGDRIGVDKATLTSLMVMLDERGLIRRGTDPRDGRRRLVEFTVDLQHLIDGAMLGAARVDEELLRPLSESESDEVAEIWGAVAAGNELEGTALASDSPDSKLQSTPGWRLRRVRQIHSRLWSAFVPALTPPQYAALDVLYYSGPLEVLATARLAGLEVSNGARILRRAARKNLVSRSRVRGDARRIQLELTDEGRRVLLDATAGVRLVQETLMRPIPDAGARRFHELTARVARLDPQ